jgi:hypothetical protein
VALFHKEDVVKKQTKAKTVGKKAISSGVRVKQHRKPVKCHKPSTPSQLMTRTMRRAFEIGFKSALKELSELDLVMLGLEMIVGFDEKAKPKENR